MRGARRPKSANDFYKDHEDALIDREKTYYVINNDPAMYYHVSHLDMSTTATNLAVRPSSIQQGVVERTMTPR